MLVNVCETRQRKANVRLLNHVRGCKTVISRHVRTLVVGLAMVGASRGTAQAQARVSDSLAVRAVATGIVEADNARDLTAVLACYAQSAILLPPNEAPVAGHAAIEPRYQALFRDYTPAIEGRIDELVVASDWAYVRGHNGGWLRGRDGKPDKALTDVYLMILARQGGSWRITRLMWHRAEHAGT